jgi:helix-turn-helix protein
MTPPTSGATARRMFGLVEPIGLIPYATNEPADALLALGLRNFWDTYFAGRAAPLGRTPAEVVHAIFYNFAPGEATRHIPRVWDVITPDAAYAARQHGCVVALRRLLGDLAEAPGLARTADLLTKAAISPSTVGRPLYAGPRAMPLPEAPIARLWHAGDLLREHRGDGHTIALVSNGIGGTEAHVLLALSEGMPAEIFGRVSHLPQAQLAAVIDGMRARGLIGADGWLTADGRATKQRIEALTDDLAAPPYGALEPSELDQLIAGLEPLAAALAIGSS